MSASAAAPTTPTTDRPAHLWPIRAAAGGLAVVAGLHLVWATGRTWPLPDRRTFARTVLGGERVGTPGPAACVAVAGLLTGIAATLLDRSAPKKSRLPEPAARLVLGAAAVGFGLRAVGIPGVAGFTVSGRRSSGLPEPFRTLDLSFYSPLCAALTGACIVARGQGTA